MGHGQCLLFVVVEMWSKSGFFLLQDTSNSRFPFFAHAHAHAHAHAYSCSCSSNFMFITYTSKRPSQNRVNLWNVSDHFRFVKDSDSAREITEGFTDTDMEALPFDDQELRNPDRPITSLSFCTSSVDSRSGKLNPSLVAIVQRGRVVVWDYERDLKMTIPQNDYTDNDSITDVAFSSDGQALAVLAVRNKRSVMLVWRVIHKRTFKVHEAALEMPPPLIVKRALDHPGRISKLAFFPPFDDAVTVDHLEQQMEALLSDVSKDSDPTDYSVYKLVVGGEHAVHLVRINARIHLEQKDTSSFDFKSATTAMGGRRKKVDMSQMTGEEKKRRMTMQTKLSFRVDVTGTATDMENSVVDCLALSPEGYNLLTGETHEDIPKEVEIWEELRTKAITVSVAMERLRSLRIDGNVLTTRSEELLAKRDELDQETYVLSFQTQRLNLPTHKSRHVRMWTVIGDSLNPSPLGQHERTVTGVSFASAEFTRSLYERGIVNRMQSYAASSSQDETVRLWKYNTQSSLPVSGGHMVVERPLTVSQQLHFQKLASELRHLERKLEEPFALTNTAANEQNGDDALLQQLDEIDAMVTQSKPSNIAHSYSQSAGTSSRAAASAAADGAGTGTGTATDESMSSNAVTGAATAAATPIGSATNNSLSNTHTRAPKQKNQLNLHMFEKYATRQGLDDEVDPTADTTSSSKPDNRKCRGCSWF
jgi:WD40 repeat protein